MKKKKTQKSKADVGRRNFVKLLPALGAAGLAASNLPLDALGANCVADTASFTEPISNPCAAHHQRDDAPGGKTHRHRVH